MERALHDLLRDDLPARIFSTTGDASAHRCLPVSEREGESKSESKRRRERDRGKEKESVRERERTRK